jgi:hypothetical protein
MDIVGQEMLTFQAWLAEKYKYKKIPLNAFSYNLIEKYKNSLPMWCKMSGDNKALYSFAGTQLCTGYRRIVIGDYGAFVEIAPEQLLCGHIKCMPGQEYRFTDERYKNNVKYLWLTAKDSTNCKIYFQQKTVVYADYLPGMYYISPYEVLPANS